MKYSPGDHILEPNIPGFKGDYTSIDAFYESLPYTAVSGTSFSPISFELAQKQLLSAKNGNPEKLFRIYHDAKSAAIQDIEEKRRKAIEEGREPTAFDGDLLGLYGVARASETLLLVRPTNWSDLLATNRNPDYRSEVPFLFSSNPNKFNPSSLFGNVIGVNVVPIIRYKGTYATIISERAETVDNAGKTNFLAGYLDNEVLRYFSTMVERGIDPLLVTALREFWEEFPKKHPFVNSFIGPGEKFNLKKMNFSNVIAHGMYFYGLNTNDGHPEAVSLIYFNRAEHSIEDDVKALEGNNSTEEAENIRIISLLELRERMAYDNLAEKFVDPHVPLAALLSYLSVDPEGMVKGLGLKKAV